MSTREHSRLVLNGIRQAASVSVHWSLECPKLCPAGQRKINSHLTADRRPTSVRDVVAREMRRSVIGWSFDSANLDRPEERPKPSHWKGRTNDVFRVSASDGLSNMSRVRRQR
jgi:hypothetical protein